MNLGYRQCHRRAQGAGSPLPSTREGGTTVRVAEISLTVAVIGPVLAMVTSQSTVSPGSTGSLLRLLMLTSNEGSNRSKVAMILARVHQTCTAACAATCPGPAGESLNRRPVWPLP